MKIGNRLGIGLMAAVIVLAGCGGGSTATTTGTKTPYKLTLSTDLSGPFSAVAGISYAEGFEAWMTHVNSTGGINGHKVEMDVMDDRSDVTTGLANYQKALNSDSLAFLLTAASAINGPLGPKANADHFVMSTPIFNGGQNIPDYVYDFNFSASLAASVIVKFAESKATAGAGKKVAFISYDTPSQRASIPVLEALFKTKGWTTVYNQFVPQTSVDFSVAGAQISGLKPDFVIGNMLDSQFAGFVTSIRSRGLDAPVSNFTANIAGTTWAKINDPNVFAPTPVPSLADLSIPAVKDLNDIAKESGHTQGMGIPAWAVTYVHAQVVAAALAKCSDPCTREKFNTALGNTTVDPHGLMVGRPGYTPTDKTLEKGLAIIAYDAKKGLTTPVTGFGFA